MCSAVQKERALSAMLVVVAAVAAWTTTNMLNLDAGSDAENAHDAAAVGCSCWRQWDEHRRTIRKKER